jgi:hypothetical protein
LDAVVGWDARVCLFCAHRPLATARLDATARVLGCLTS